MCARYVVVDTNMVAAQHIRFNASFLKIFLKFRKETFLFFDDRHFDCLNKLVDFDGCFYQKIDVISGQERSFFKKVLYDIISFNKIFFTARKKKCDGVFFLSVFTPCLFLINLYSFVFRVPVKVVLHSEVEAIFQRDPVRGIAKLRGYKFWLLFYLKSNFRLLGNVKLFALAVHAEKKAREMLDLYKIEVFGHPYVREAYIDDVSSSEGFYFNYDPNKKYIAFTGYARLDRGIEHFFDLAKAMNDNNFNDYVFIVLGDIDPRVVLPKEMSNLQLPFKGMGFVDSAVLTSSVKKIDFIFYPYDESNYRVSSSGAVLEHLHLNKVLVSLDNSYFKYLIKKGINNIYTFDSNQSLIDYFRRELVNASTFDSQSRSNDAEEIECALNKEIVDFLVDAF